MNRRGWSRVGTLVVLLLLVGVAVAGWWVYQLRRGGAPEHVEISAEAARAAEDKIDRLRSGGEPVALTEIEINSLFRYRAEAWRVDDLYQPSVRLSGDTMRLAGVVPTDRLPSHPELDVVRPWLPDSSTVEVRGRLLPLSEGRAAFDVEAVEFAGLPVPERFVPEVLDRLGRREESGLPASAIALRLPPGVGSARVQDGRLLLTP